MKEQILQVVVPLLGTVVTAALTWAGAKLVNLIQAKTKNEYLKGALVRAEQAVQTAVLEVKQVYVDAIKVRSADGKLTSEEAEEAKKLAIDAAKSYLGTKGLAVLVDVFGFDGSALDSFLGGKIEATVSQVPSASVAKVVASSSPPAAPAPS